MIYLPIMKNDHISPQFKTDLELAISKAGGIPGLSKVLGIQTNTIYYWRNNFIDTDKRKSLPSLPMYKKLLNFLYGELTGGDPYPPVSGIPIKFFPAIHEFIDAEYGLQMKHFDGSNYVAIRVMVPQNLPKSSVLAIEGKLYNHDCVLDGNLIRVTLYGSNEIHTFEIEKHEIYLVLAKLGELYF